MRSRGRRWFVSVGVVFLCGIPLAAAPDEGNRQASQGTVAVQVGLDASLAWQVATPHVTAVQTTTLTEDPGAALARLSAATAPEQVGEAASDEAAASLAVGAGAAWTVTDRGGRWRPMLWVLMSAWECQPSSLIVREGKTPDYEVDLPRDSDSDPRNTNDVYALLTTTAAGPTLALASVAPPAAQRTGAFPSRGLRRQTPHLPRITVRLNEAGAKDFIERTLRAYATTDVVFVGDADTTTRDVLRAARMLRAADAKVWFRGTSVPRPKLKESAAFRPPVQVTIAANGSVTCQHPTEPDRIVAEGSWQAAGKEQRKETFERLHTSLSRLHDANTDPGMAATILADPATPWQYVYWTYAALLQAEIRDCSFRSLADEQPLDVDDPNAAWETIRWAKHMRYTLAMATPRDALVPPSHPMEIRLYRRDKRAKVKAPYTVVRTGNEIGDRFLLPRGDAGVPSHPEYQARMRELRRVLASRVPQSFATVIEAPAPHGGLVPFADMLHVMRTVRSLGHQDLLLGGPGVAR